MDVNKLSLVWEWWITRPWMDSTLIAKRLNVTVGEVEKAIATLGKMNRGVHNE